MAIVSVVFSAPVWRFMDDSKLERGRAVAIDGMRGYLALSVMLQHAVVARQWQTTGNWVLPGDWFYSQLGSIAVSLFFSITGFLFWGKLVRDSGRPNWIRLYVGRIFRIAPVYIIAVSCMVAIVFWRSGFQLREAPGELFDKIAHWYGLGLLVGHDFNGYANVWIILAGVVWTLKYEWRFYFALLPASFLSRGKLHLPAAAGLLVLALVLATVKSSDNWTYISLFASGMLAASIKETWPRLSLPAPLASTLALLTLAALLALHPAPYSPVQAAWLAVVFFLVCNGATFFGIFTTNASIRLGHASYGIYLLQGLVFATGWDNAPMRAFISGGTLHFWIATIIGALLLSAVAAVLYRFIERPGIERGRIVGQRTSDFAERLRARLSFAR
jgi:peptidoglycan/LPS O-acetylase OafA/YrhL